MIPDTARGAWRELERHVRPFVARRVRTRADVDDVVQEVMLRMLRGLPNLHDEQRLGPWVYQIARSAIADFYRAGARQPLAESVSADLSAAEHEQDESDSAYGAMLSCIAPFVALLPAPYREAVTLTELEGLTQAEAAAMLGASLSAMKSRVQRGRAQLREALLACCSVALDARGRVMSCEGAGASANATRCSSATQDGPASCSR